MKIEQSLIFRNIEVSGSDELFRIIGDNMIQKGIAKHSFTDALVEREHSNPTGLMLTGYNVAIPHTDGFHVNINRLALCTLKKPIEFRRMDNPTEVVLVDIVFILAMTKDVHMETLKSLIGLIQNKELISSIIDTNDETLIDSINQYFKGEES